MVIPSKFLWPRSPSWPFIRGGAGWRSPSLLLLVPHRRWWSLPAVHCGGGAIAPVAAAGDGSLLGAAASSSSPVVDPPTVASSSPGVVPPAWAPVIHGGAVASSSSSMEVPPAWAWSPRVVPPEWAPAVHGGAAFPLVAAAGRGVAPFSRAPRRTRIISGDHHGSLVPAGGPRLWAPPASLGWALLYCCCRGRFGAFLPLVRRVLASHRASSFLFTLNFRPQRYFSYHVCFSFRPDGVFRVQDFKLDILRKKEYWKFFIVAHWIITC